MKDLPVPSLAMLVASASMEQEIACLLRLNPHMEFVIYTLDFRCAAALPRPVLRSSASVRPRSFRFRCPR